MSDFWKDKDRRRGAIWSFVIHIALLILFMFFGLKYLEPKPEDGIVINFGNSQTGMGNEADGAQQPVQSQPETSVPQQAETQAEEIETPTATQDVIDAPSLPKQNETAKKKPTEEKPVKREPTPEELEQQRLEREREEQRRKLEERFGKVSDSKTGGEGEAGGPGDQGDPSGDPKSSSRTGGSSGTGSGAGPGGDGNYLLGNRQALNKPGPGYECPDQGRVVVKIYVDRNGKVTQAFPGERIPNGAASTTTSSCLYSRAKNAALKTTWQPDSDAPVNQIGYIIYTFTKN